MGIFGRKKELQAVIEKLQAAENRIKDLEADLRAIEDHVAVLVMSSDGLIERANALFLEAVGYQENELIGQHHRILCERDYAISEGYRAFWQALVRGHSHQGLFTHIDANGRRIQLESRYLPVLTDKGFLKRIITLVNESASARGLNSVLDAGS